MYNKENERMKFKYRNHLKRINRKDWKTVIAELKHIIVFEKFISFASFAKYKDELADSYIQFLTKEGYSLSFLTDNLRSLRNFLYWLERQRGYRGKIKYDHIEYLNISKNQLLTAKASNYKKSYTFDDILSTINSMPTTNIIDRRNKAIVCLQALCGLRISELRTVKIKSIICEDGKCFVHINPKTIQTKFAKTRNANFLSLPENITKTVIDWKGYLLSIDFNVDDFLFPQIQNSFTQASLIEKKITKKEIKSTTTIRQIFKKAFTKAGHEYLKPHSFRTTIAKWAERQSPLVLNAIRQSLGHSSIDTTLSSYGQLSDYDQRKAIGESMVNIKNLPD